MAVIKFNRPLVLATASLARRKLMADAGFSFNTQVVAIDETPKSGEAVASYVERLARAKAGAVMSPAPDAIVVAVDTAIGIGKKIIGKPVDELHARAILRELSGRAHEVLSAIAVRDLLRASTDVIVTRTEVDFISLTEEMVEWYIATGEWKGRAGAYAIQEKGAVLVKSVKGCFTNVIGLSMPTLLGMLSKVQTQKTGS